MNKVNVVFWSQSGNTENMANAIGAGISAAGKEAAITYVADASLDELKNRFFVVFLDMNHQFAPSHLRYT